MKEFALPRRSDHCGREEDHGPGMRISFALFLWGFLPWMILFPKGPGSGGMPLHSLPAPLVIVTQPTDIIDCEDHIVTFKVVIDGGTEPVTYAWQRMRPPEPDFTDIPPGAPNISYPAPGSLRIDNVGSFENPGGSRYRVVITDISGSVTSAGALLTVNEITDIVPSVAFPAKINVILCEEAGFSYTVTTAGTPPAAYQWKKYLSPGVWANVTDNGIISGSQGAVLSFTGATPAESGQYKVNITFHSSGADCQVSSDDRIRVVTFQGDPVAPVIPPPPTACLGLLPDPLTATPASEGSGNFLYQWQESPDGLTWSDLPGATTLTYQPPIPAVNNWYRLSATDNGTVSCGNVTSAAVLQPVTDCFNLHYRSVQNGIWHDRTTWEAGPDGITWSPALTWPTSAMRTIRIREGYLVTATLSVTADEVTVEAGGALTVENGVTFTHSGASPASALQVDGNAAKQGSLVVRGLLNGLIRCRRHFDPARWTIMASPLKVTEGFGENSSAISYDAVNGDYDFAGYQEMGNAGWQYFTTVPGSLQPGRGYVVRTTATGGADEGILTFTGTLNGTVNDTVSPMVWRSAPRHGWNGTGNPFTSAIGITTSAATPENFLTRNAAILEDSYGAVYLWNQTGPFDGSQQYYKAIGNSGYNFQGFSFFEGADPDYLQSGQGFLINVRENGRAVFSEAMQLHAPAVKLKSAEQSWPGLVLTARQGNRERQTMVAFHETMTRGLDKTFDVGLLSSDNFRLYTLLVDGGNSTGMQVQCLPADRYGELVVPVGIDLPPGGEVTFGVKGVFLPGKWIPFLEYRQSSVTVPLGEGGGEYSVVLPAGNSGTGRFFLRFGERQVTASPLHPLSEDSKSRVPAYAVTVREGKLVISGNEVFETRAALYDLTGRKVMEFPVESGGGGEIPLPRLSAGIYLLRFSGKREPVTVKVPVW